MFHIDIYSLIIDRPTPAIEVFRRVRALIADEHRRLHMGTWFQVLGDLDHQDASKFPACRTIGCLAGWEGFVVGCQTPRDPFTRVRINDSWTTKMACVAGDFRSPIYDELKCAFMDGEHYYAVDGSRDQADKAIHWLTSFMSKWERELTDRIILPGGRVLQRLQVKKDE